MHQDTMIMHRKPEKSSLFVDTLSTALGLCNLGLAVHWDQPRSKKPIAAEWSTIAALTAEKLTASYRPGYNVGVRLGRWSRPYPGCGLIAVDIDIKEPDAKCEPFEVLYRWYDGEIFQVISGSGIGQHWYFACPLDDLPVLANAVLAKSDRLFTTPQGKTVPAWTIEILSTGKQIITPPSIHPDTRQAYRWVTKPGQPIPPMPRNILSAISMPDTPSEPKPTPVRTALPRQPPTCYRSHDSIADRFRVVPWQHILEPHGWQFVRQQGDVCHWVRPGKNPKDGVSASTRGDTFYPFTSSTEFTPDRGYSKFHAYAILEHGADMRQAAKHLSNLGRAS
jgi:hypothetical protein